MKYLTIVLFALLASCAQRPVQEDGTVFGWASFFVTENEGMPSKQDSRAMPTVVHNGEKFGSFILYHTKKKEIPYRLELTPPSAPENFPCPTCLPGQLNISNDRKTITVNRIIYPNQYKGPLYYEDKLPCKPVAFGWRISKNDPRGIYRLKVWLDNEAIGDFTFEVK